MLDLDKYSETWKSRKIADIKNETRREYEVPLHIDFLFFALAFFLQRLQLLQNLWHFEQ
jgi:hypothetical protein